MILLTHQISIEKTFALIFACQTRTSCEQDRFNQFAGTVDELTVMLDGTLESFGDDFQALVALTEKLETQLDQAGESPPRARRLMGGRGWAGARGLERTPWPAACPAA